MHLVLITGLILGAAMVGGYLDVVRTTLHNKCVIDAATPEIAKECE